jgi:cytosine/adenosine deaminase-related metal-dependent hydrolase
MSDEENAVFASLGALEALRCGNTTMLELGRGVATYAHVIAPSGLRLVLSDMVMDVDYDGILREGRFDYSERLGEQGMQRTADLFSRWHRSSNGRITCFVGPYATEACSPAFLRQTRAFAEQHDTGYSIHQNESRWETEAVMKVRGLRPTEYLFHADFLGPRLVGGHCRYMSPSEISLMGHSRGFVSFNAAMAARRGVSPPIQALEAAGSIIAVGSDNMAEDMVEVMRTALFMERVARQDGLHLQPEDVLEWATRHGARALHLEDKVGSLEVGKKADLIIINARRPHLVPTLRIVSAFIHNGQGGDVESVMVDGQWLMRDGKVLTMDETDIVERAQEIGLRVWRELVERYPNVPFPIKLPPPHAREEDP